MNGIFMISYVTKISNSKMVERISFFYIVNNGK